MLDVTIPDLTFPMVEYGKLETPWDLRVLLYKGGAKENVGLRIFWWTARLKTGVPTIHPSGFPVYDMFLGQEPGSTGEGRRPDCCNRIIVVPRNCFVMRNSLIL